MPRLVERRHCVAHRIRPRRATDFTGLPPLGRRPAALLRYVVQQPDLGPRIRADAARGWTGGGVVRRRRRSPRRGRARGHRRSRRRAAHGNGLGFSRHRRISRVAERVVSPSSTDDGRLFLCRGGNGRALSVLQRRSSREARRHRRIRPAAAAHDDLQEQRTCCCCEFRHCRACRNDDNYCDFRWARQHHLWRLGWALRRAGLRAVRLRVVGERRQDHESHEVALVREQRRAAGLVRQAGARGRVEREHRGPQGPRAAGSRDDARTSRGSTYHVEEASLAHRGRLRQRDVGLQRVIVLRGLRSRLGRPERPRHEAHERRRQPRRAHGDRRSARALLRRRRLLDVSSRLLRSRAVVVLRLPPLPHLRDVRPRRAVRLPSEARPERTLLRLVD
mmetsp:Transcript_9632/g.29258  ORF Transcript_9632/g.29258 Transcript_9632/m.29258 type:complete len:391 (+) Transcript_9632:1776-2948(+)